jgi:ATP-dependent DNA helicase RecQ
MAARKKSTTRKPRTATTKKKRGADAEEGADRHEAISVFELSDDESADEEPTEEPTAKPAPRARRRRATASAAPLDETDDGAQSAIDDIAESEGRALEGDGDAELDEEMDAASSAAMQALKIIDRDTLLAQLGVEARDDAEDEADDAEDEETLDEGDLDAPEPIRKAALRLGISKLHPEQKRVLGEILAGRDVLMVLPTGFGKSACYQIPSMILPKPVLVISPLLALMRDQSDKLDQLDIPCVRLDGTVRGKERQKALARVAQGGSLLVLTTPESLFNEEVHGALRKSGISMAAVDEAHCISEWGFDFRPAYLQLGERIRGLGRAPILALTATATEKVRDAIQRFLGLEDTVVVSSSPHRSNLAFDVLRCGEGARLRAMLRLAFRVRRPGIIYCSTTREVDEIYTVFQRFGIPCHRYHGKMSAAERTKNQDGFMRRGRRTVMVATSAFGLGIDKSDIRYVMHYHAPGSLEQYVQEAGRAGRDGRRANCILLYAPEDRKIHEALLSRSRVRPEQLYKLGRALAAWAGEDKTPSLSALALSANLGTRTTGALLALLEEATLVRFDQTAVYVTVPADQIEEESRKLASQFETLRTQDQRRLEAVADYADVTECRGAYLAGYFGEASDFRCGLCDRCRGSTDRPDSFFEPLAPPRRSSRRGGPQRGRGDPRGRGRGRDRNRHDRGRGGHRQPAHFEGRRGPGPQQGGGPPWRGEPGRNEMQGEHAGGRRRRGRRRGRRGGQRPFGIPGSQPNGGVPHGVEMAGPPPPADLARPSFDGPPAGDAARFDGRPFDANGDGTQGPHRRRRRRGRRRGRGRGPRPPFDGGGNEPTPPPVEPT